MTQQEGIFIDVINIKSDGNPWIDLWQKEISFHAVLKYFGWFFGGWGMLENRISF